MKVNPEQVPLWERFGRWLGRLSERLPVFFGVWICGLVATAVMVYAFILHGPNPTEAYEGFGDALIAAFFIMAGAVVSILVAAWAATKQSPNR